ncbi:MAG TPA: M1 family aminopeptidase [Ferruginibacter sp.]|nr:M1 family aminopeptidase [Ferruginibacter sp.]HRE62644.1 M1 family aminopeptidase [Ferruginibacter sp.]
MKKYYLTLLVFIAACLQTNAQITPYQQMQDREVQHSQALFSREENQTEATNGLDYDLKYYRLALRLNPDTSISTGKYVWGNITTYFTTGISNFNRINFDFASALVCDSVYYHGVKLAPANILEIGDTLRITIPTIANVNTLDSIHVFYKGTPPQVPGWTTTGFVRSTHNPSGSYIYTLSEPYSAHTWWPCKSMIASDKADSVDFYISTPSAFRVAANGKRISETTGGGQRLTYWKHRYPISTYQIALGVANYVQYPASPTIVNIGGTNMDLYNLLWNGTNTANAQTALNRTADMLTVMSNRFSDYPFKNEKYGHYTFGFGGGMEHNTFSGMGTTTYDATNDWSVIAHELGHQWFGAAVTCGSWRDIWVNEGFARYSEVVYLEGKANGNGITTTPTAHRASFKSNARTAKAKSIYQADTSSMGAIFSPSVYIYERGAMFISMLRKTLGDSKFFQALQNYQTDPTLQYKNAFTDDVKRHMEAVTGLDLSEMFSDWVYNIGHPQYATATWNNIGNQVILRLVQTPTSGSTNIHFDVPLVIRFSRISPAQDTTVVIFDRGGTLYTVNNGVFTTIGAGNMIQVGLPFVPSASGIAFDPESEVLVDATFTRDAGLTLLATKLLEFTAVKNNNNAKLSWKLDQSTDYNSFDVERSFDGTNFTKIATQNKNQFSNGTIQFNHTDFNMPSGIIYYRIRVNELNGSSFYSKVAAINNKSTEVFEVNPNPATDHFFISHGSSKTIVANLRILNAAGKTVKVLNKQTILPASKLRISVQDLPAGIYYVEVEGEQYFKMTKKLMIAK